jgi:NTP pyrophosphatase (non-canonical NTP hydrolase)
MAKLWYRTIENCDEKLSQELFDCLFAIIAIADELHIDFLKTVLIWKKEWKKLMENTKGSQIEIF